MGKVALMILGISLMLNLASGLVFEVVPEFGNDPEIATIYGDYDVNDGDLFINTMEEEVRPSGGALEDSGDSIWRVFDMINVGQISKFSSTVKNYLYGFVKFLNLIVGPYLTPNVADFLFGTFGAMYVIMTIIYIAALFTLWTNRSITGN